MAIWGIESGYCAEDLLSPLELYSYGGATLNGNMSYIIRSKLNIDFKYEIECSKLKVNIKEVEKAHRIHLRKYKLIKINESNDRV